MSTQLFHEITLHLDDIRYLFADPEPGSGMFVSGIDYLYSEIKTYSWRDKFKVTIELPEERLAEGLAVRTRQQVKRYCHFKIEENHRELVALHRQGVASLWVGLAVLMVCVALAFAFTLVAQWGAGKILGALLQIVAVLFAASAGWVALWQPAEIFLYDWWPFRQDMRTYRQIAEAEIAIRAAKAEDTPASAGTGEGKRE